MKRPVWYLPPERGFERELKKRVEYFSRQIVDMFSPTNFLATNPDALEKALATDGESLVRGLENLVRDIEAIDLLNPMPSWPARSLAVVSEAREAWGALRDGGTPALARPVRAAVARWWPGIRQGARP